MSNTQISSPVQLFTFLFSKTDELARIASANGADDLAIQLEDLAEAFADFSTVGEDMESYLNDPDANAALRSGDQPHLSGPI